MPPVNYRRKKSGAHGLTSHGRKKDEEKKRKIDKWIKDMRRKVAKREGRR